MIRRLYANNYRCLVDFSWEPGSENLILGYNGSGKTSALDAIDLIRAWTCGWERLSDLLDSETTTRWDRSEVARFELDLSAPEGLYRYKVEFEILSREPASLRTESLRIDDRTIFVRNQDGVTFHNGLEKPTHQVLVPTSQSAVSALAGMETHGYVEDFMTRLQRMVIARPMPPLMDNEARSSEERPRHRFENFVAWYWGQTENGRFTDAMFGLLKEVWSDFDFLDLERLGRARSLRAVFNRPQSRADESAIQFHELSEGERMLVVLYTLLAYQRATPPTTIVIDEPDNFVALAELQPWLMKLLDERPEEGQIVLVSHNAEIIQGFGESQIALFSRPDHLSPVKVSNLPADDTGLSLSERLARGWVGA